MSETELNMTFEILKKRVINKWWLIILFPLVLTLVFFPWAKEKTYQASTSVGLQLNSSTINQTGQKVLDSNQAYVASFEQLSLYLTNRFSSVEVQDRIANAVGEYVPTYSEKKPFYTVLNQSGGFVTLNLTTDNKDTGQKFLTVVEQQVYPDIIKEWNSVSPADMQVKPMTQFLGRVAEVSKSKQLQFLPAIAGLVIGLFIASLWPNEEVMVSIQKKSKSNS